MISLDELRSVLERVDSETETDEAIDAWFRSHGLDPDDVARVSVEHAVAVVDDGYPDGATVDRRELAKTLATLFTVGLALGLELAGEDQRSSRIMAAPPPAQESGS